MIYCKTCNKEMAENEVTTIKTGRFNAYLCPTCKGPAFLIDTFNIVNNQKDYLFSVKMFL